MQNGPKSEKLRRSFIFGLQNGLKSDKQSIEIVFFGKKITKQAEKHQAIHRKFIFGLKNYKMGQKVTNNLSNCPLKHHQTLTSCSLILNF